MVRPSPPLSVALALTPSWSAAHHRTDFEGGFPRNATTAGGTSHSSGVLPSSQIKLRNLTSCAFLSSSKKSVMLITILYTSDFNGGLFVKHLSSVQCILQNQVNASRHFHQKFSNQLYVLFVD